MSFYTLQQFIEGNNQTRALTKLTTRSEREERILKEQKSVFETVEKVRQREEGTGGGADQGDYIFGKRIKRID